MFGLLLSIFVILGGLTLTVTLTEVDAKRWNNAAGVSGKKHSAAVDTVSNEFNVFSDAELAKRGGWKGGMNIGGIWGRKRTGENSEDDDDYDDYEHEPFEENEIKQTLDWKRINGGNFGPK